MAKLYKTSFRYQGKKKLSFIENQIVLNYISLSLKNLFNKDVIKNKKKGKKKKTYYTLDKEVYEYHEQLYKYRHDRNDEDTNDNDLIADLKTSLF